MFLSIIIICVCAHKWFLLTDCHPVSLFILSFYIFLEFCKIQEIFLQVFHLFIFLPFWHAFLTDVGTSPFVLPISFSLPAVSQSVIWPDFVFHLCQVFWACPPLDFHNCIFILKGKITWCSSSFLIPPHVLNIFPCLSSGICYAP